MGETQLEVGDAHRSGGQARAKIPYQPHLEGLRGAMALWVFAGHVSVYVGFQAPVLRNYAVAVDIFMFLSGLLIAGNFLEQHEPIVSGAGLRRFWLRRLFRIAPVYFPLLLIAMVGWQTYPAWIKQIYATFPPSWSGQIVHDPSVHEPTLSNILLHLSFLFGLIPQYASNNPLPDWSLSLEMQFYAVLPFLLFATRRIGVWPVWLVCIVVTWWTMGHVGLYLSPTRFGLWPQPSMLPFKLGCFWAGILLAMRRHDSSPAILVMLFCSAIFNQSIYFSFAVLLCFLIQERATERMVGWARVALSNPVAAFFGKISYPVYLVHLLIAIPALALLTLFPWYRSCPPIGRYAIGLMAVAPPVVLLSWLIHHWVEQPGIELGRRLSRRAAA